jgi:hypothetical protein
MRQRQAAVEAHLEQLVKDTPTRRVGLVAFSNEVHLYGDGSLAAPKVLAGDRLNNYAELLSIGESFTLDQPVSDAKASLSKALYELEEGGATALGPAVVTAVAVASRAIGSQVLVCTGACGSPREREERPFPFMSSHLQTD